MAHVWQTTGKYALAKLLVAARLTGGNALDRVRLPMLEVAPGGNRSACSIIICDADSCSKWWQLEYCSDISG